MSSPDESAHARIPTLLNFRGVTGHLRRAVTVVNGWNSGHQGNLASTHAGDQLILRPGRRERFRGWNLPRRKIAASDG